MAFLDQNLQNLKHLLFCSISWYIQKCEFLFEKYVKCLKLQKNAQTHSDIQIMRATRHEKVQTSYFSTRIFLGTIVVPMVPKKYNFQFKTKINEKQTHLTHKWHCTTTHGTPMVPKILFSKNSRSKLFNAVSTVPVAILDQKLQPASKKVRLEDEL